MSPAGSPRKKKRRSADKTADRVSGKLRIGDNWNAITIIALSQNNPLKAIAEFVENSIDANANQVTIIRGKERGEPYLKIVDDGAGIPKNDEGMPDFKYVATHICDSLKRKLKEEGIQGIQGEFGIGLLSFWTVGERLTLSSAGMDGRTYQMEMKKNEPGYSIGVRKSLFSHPGTELLVRPLLPGLRQVSGEKIQNYLASELRDRIRKSGVRIKILDRTSKKDLEVQPRQFTGRLLHEIGSLPSESGEIYVELYLNAPSPDNQVGLFKGGTRVLSSLAEMDIFNAPPWNAGYLQGMIDAPFIQLTPGTRTGVIQDERFEELREALEGLSTTLNGIIQQQKEAEEEQASRNILKSVQKALKEAFLTLPPEDYSWFDLHSGKKKGGPESGASTGVDRTVAPGVEPMQASDGTIPPEEIGPIDVEDREGGEGREFFTYPGPLYAAVISPSAAVMKVGTQRGFRCIPRDKSRRVIEENVSINWKINEGGGGLSSDGGEIVTYTAPDEPGLVTLNAVVTQNDVSVSAQAAVTVSESLIERPPGEHEGKGRGLPGYTFIRAPGELWRSRYDEKNNLIVINNGHRDYQFAAQKPARKLKYICRLFCKELVLANFVGFEAKELLERVIELSLYVEEHLK
jgi:hypothetical protein